MRAVVTCECCGFRQSVERSIFQPEVFYVICHNCEGVLRVEVQQRDLLKPHKVPTQNKSQTA